MQSTDSGESPPYLEGEHWVKGKLIGTGAFCSCFLARDIKNGTMFAVKQVKLVLNHQSSTALPLILACPVSVFDSMMS